MHVTKWQSPFSIVGITVDEDHSIVYFTCRRHGLWKLMIDDSSSTPAVVHSNTDIDACGIVFDGNNLLYFCDKSGHFIYQYDITENTVSSFAGMGRNWYINDSPVIEAPLDTPDGIARDSNGNLYVAERSAIRKINITEKTVETLFELNYLNFDYFNSIAVRPDGVVFYSNGSDIRKIEHKVSSWLAGVTYDPDILTDGTLEDCQFGWVNSLGLDFDGTILVCDNANVIRRVDYVQDQVTTIRTDKFTFAPSCVVGVGNGIIFVGTRSGEILKLEDIWYIERLLWIGNLKENTKECYFAALPRDIIREIIAVMRE